MVLLLTHRSPSTNSIMKRTMRGTPFEEPQIYGDTSGLPVPFAFNKYLSKYDGWVEYLTAPIPDSMVKF